MIRESYNLNRVFAHRSVEPTALVEATLPLLVAFTGSGGFLPAPPATHTALPSNWIMDWRRFFDVGNPDLLNLARRLDTKLVPALHNVPGVPGLSSLPVRNLLRGSRVEEAARRRPSPSLGARGCASMHRPSAPQVL